MDPENVCDACAGTGQPTSGAVCMCAGTGKMSEAARLFLRPALVEAYRVVQAARDCGTHPVNDDTCGVCGLHFHECESEMRCVGDETDGRDIPIGREFACPGARVRLALKSMVVQAPA